MSFGRALPRDQSVADFTVDIVELSKLAWAPAQVLICENATTIGTLPPLPGVVAVHGMGFAAPTLAEVRWIQSANQWYWGDVDTYGFQILGHVRAVLPEVRSLLMGVATLEEFMTLAVSEPRPFRGEMGYLTAAERAALARVRVSDRISPPAPSRGRPRSARARRWARTAARRDPRGRRGTW